MQLLREHIGSVGVEHALAALGPDVKGKGEEIQYGGHNLEGNGDAHFIEQYLNRAGISLIQGAAPEGQRKAISTVSPSRDEQGLHSRGDSKDFFPNLQTLQSKLEEARHLPGLEKSEDLSKLTGGETGGEVKSFSPEVLKKLDDTYGAGQWIVKPYDDDAYAGKGIYFPQRVQQIQQDAKNAIWASGSELAKYGFAHLRDDKGHIVGIKHQGGDEYRFGTDKYNSTIQGDARHWADQAATAAASENGTALERGREGNAMRYMAQPAFPVTGVSNEERARGITFKRGQEGRVHVVTRNGKAELVPHSTWLKQEPLPVVFENDDTRAMAQAAVDAINALPESERKGQLYAPDIVKTADGYKVVEANPANEAGASGYLQDNPFVIDSYVSHLTGREPAHVQFIRKLLSARKHTEHFSEGGSSLRGVEIFAAGTHRGKTYTTADLDSMVRNFRRASTGQRPGFRVPLVIGHEETQEFLERSDLPAAGWAARVWRDGDKLKADFEDVPPKVARLLKGKAYRTVSSEVYDEPPEGVPGDGKMLRRVALLGGDIPQVKSLDDIPEPEPHSERFARWRPVVFRFREVIERPGAGTFFCFSEVEPMDRQKMLEALAQHGIDTSTITDAVPDEVLAEMLRVCEDKDDQGQGDDQYDENEELPEPANDDEKKAYAEKARKMGERAKRHMEKYCSRMDDVSTETATPTPTPTEMDDEPNPNPAARMPNKTTVTHQYNEKRMQATINAAVTRAVAAAVEKFIKPAKEEFTKFTEEQLSAQKREDLHTFLQGCLKDGYVTPAQLDEGNPANLYKIGMLQGSKAIVEKFKEGKTEVKLTQYDLWKRGIRAGRPHKFSERLKPSGAATATDDRKQWAEATYSKFSESFSKAGGMKRDEFVSSMLKLSDADFADEQKRWDETAA